MNTLINVSVIEAMVGRAEEIASANGLHLDMSSKSIEQLDKLLNGFHSEYVRETEHDMDALSGISISLGIYLGEVIRKRVGQKELLWYYGVPSAGGPETPYLRLHENEIYPVDWVVKQIEEGPKESAKSKFETYTNQLVEYAKSN